MSLRRLSPPPAELLAQPAERLLAYLDGPALLEVPGTGDEIVFVSALLHGNETSGWEIARRWLQQLGSRQPQCTFVFLLANPMAAARGERQLKSQVDFNRIWGTKPDHPLLDDLYAVYEEYAGRPLRLVLDLHNNNGLNPCYAMCMRGEGFVDARGWAGAFTGRTIGTELKLGTLMEAFGRRHPAVTLECGLPGSEEGISLGLDFLDYVDATAQVPAAAGEYHRLCGCLKVKPEHSICFGNSRADISFPANLPQLFNFKTVAEGTVFAKLNNGAGGEALELYDAKGRPQANDLLHRSGDDLVAARSFMPAMLVAQVDLARQDCLGYVLEPWDAAR